MFLFVSQNTSKYTGQKQNVQKIRKMPW